MTLSKEAVAVDCDLVSRRDLKVENCQAREIGPVTIPSLGVEGSF
jgi:hypothetical protein